REYCDELAKIIVPTEPDMWPLIMLGILGVGGLGAVAAAYAMTKPKEQP
ncbi:unnamed protein product, partial [marine sediment metagenome]